MLGAQRLDELLDVGLVAVVGEDGELRRAALSARAASLRPRERPSCASALASTAAMAWLTSMPSAGVAPAAAAPAEPASEPGATSEPASEPALDLVSSLFRVFFFGGGGWGRGEKSERTSRARRASAAAARGERRAAALPHSQASSTAMLPPEATLDRESDRSIEMMHTSSRREKATAA